MQEFFIFGCNKKHFTPTNKQNLKNNEKNLIIVSSSISNSKL